ncbi:MAG TPA: MarR family winged helix-turn-helix transcriptional regulator [Sphingomonadaceae bacterium]|nr:MarR family winged helix-turn-helix transcriptional regulator [Sphingomonadaceae bacterium]
MEWQRADAMPELMRWTPVGLAFPTFRVALIGKVMDRVTNRQLNAGFAMNYAEWRVLSRLAAHGPSSVREIAESTLSDRAEVSRAAIRLEKQGLTDRTIGPSSNVPVLFCTPAGMERYEQVREQRADFHERLLAGLDEGERAELDRLLTKIGHNVLRLDTGAGGEQAIGGDDDLPPLPERA